MAHSKPKCHPEVIHHTKKNRTSVRYGSHSQPSSNTCSEMSLIWTSSVLHFPNSLISGDSAPTGTDSQSAILQTKQKMKLDEPEDSNKTDHPFLNQKGNHYRSTAGNWPAMTNTHTHILPPDRKPSPGTANHHHVHIHTRWGPSWLFLIGGYCDCFLAGSEWDVPELLILDTDGLKISW